MYISVFKRTTDDWYPSYTVSDFDIKLVEVSLSKSDDIFIVGVWGGDDCGFECAYNDQEDAKKIFNCIIDLEYVNMQDLKRFGFKSC